MHVEIGAQLGQAAVEIADVEGLELQPRARELEPGAVHQRGINVHAKRMHFRGPAVPVEVLHVVMGRVEVLHVVMARVEVLMVRFIMVMVIMMDMARVEVMHVVTHVVMDIIIIIIIIIIVIIITRVEVGPRALPVGCHRRHQLARVAAHVQQKHAAFQAAASHWCCRCHRTPQQVHWQQPRAIAGLVEGVVYRATERESEMESEMVRERGRERWSIQCQKLPWTAAPAVPAPTIGWNPAGANGGALPSIE
jgi:hypothetical protein